MTNREFTAALGRTLRRPAFIPIPAWPLRLILGQFADELLLGGQRVLPKAAVMSGFAFDHPEIGEALRSITGAPPACGPCPEPGPAHLAGPITA